MKAVEVIITGRVQGVGFRAYVEGSARRFGVSGWVRNLFDGRVQAVIEGEDADVDAAVGACRRGPPGSRVDDVSTRRVPVGAGDGFRVRPTAMRDAE